MNNENIHIGIVGAGIIGSTIYQLLISCGKNYKVSIADQKEDTSHSINPDHYHRLKITKPTYDGHCTQFNQFVQGKTLIINALPYHQNINLFNACYEVGIPYFDLSEDDELDKYIKSLNSFDLPFTMPHCGLAPGLSTVIANDLLKITTNPKNIKIRVGALSQNAANKLRYYTSWSGEGLVNEYLGDCQVMEDGEYKTVPALSGYEKITLDGNEYECFNTSGGLGTYAKSLYDTQKSNGMYKALSVDYKTIRRTGHHNYVDFLFNDLQITQSDLTKIFRLIPSTRKDVVLLYASCSSPGRDDEHTYFNIFKPRQINGRWLTAIEYTTAIGLIVMVELFIDGKLGEQGYHRQEQVLLSDVYSTTYGGFYRQE